jgi:hypothetical protein
MSASLPLPHPPPPTVPMTLNEAKTYLLAHDPMIRQVWTNNTDNNLAFNWERVRADFRKYIKRYNLIAGVDRNSTAASEEAIRGREHKVEADLVITWLQRKQY